MKSNGFSTFKLLTVLIIFAFFSSGCDLDSILRAIRGACEVPEFVVNKTADTNDRWCDSTDCSLREAVTMSNVCPGAQTIRIPAGTYTLSLTGATEDGNLTGDLDITQDVNIIGVDYAAIDGNGTDRVLDIKAGATVTLQTLIIQNGLAQWGGGILNYGNLAATNVLIQYNHDSIGGSAAGVFTTGVTSFSHSAFFANVSYEETAGIQNEGTLSLDNVTITGNRGYGVMNDRSGTTEILFSTIADNPGAYELWNNGPVTSFVIASSIVSGHTTDGNCFAPVKSNGFNVDSSSASSGNVCGFGQSSDLNGIDPHLQTVVTIAGLPIRPLANDSPALDSADPANCSGTDQRGVARPQGPVCDRGAYEKTPAEQNAGPPVITHAPTPTLEPSPTPASVTPTSVPASGLTINKNANCRKGPAVNYDVVTSLVQGTAVTATGRNADSTWWNVQIPNGGNCWISHTTADTVGSLDSLPVLPALSLPDTPSGFNDSSTCTKKSFSVKLTWVGVSNEKGYRIYRNGELIASVDANVTQYTDNAPLGQDLEYQLAAFNENGESERMDTTVLACQ